MPRFDLTLPELETYRPDVLEPDDFDAFWTDTLSDARATGGDVVARPVQTPLRAVDVFDVTFPGFAGDPVDGWLLLPSGTGGPLPAVIEYNGYGGGRGLPHERLGWAASGYAYFLMDTRGQGSGWGSGGSTPDPHGSGPAAPGFMTRGIDDPADYYYRRVFTDAVRAVDAVRGMELVDAARVAVCGGSQGGGIALAAAGLTEGLVAVMPDVPFLCHFERAVGLTDADPYGEVVRYLSVHRGSEERVFRTLSYFDGVNMAKRASAPALFSTALLDQTCPPSTVFAARNHYASSSHASLADGARRDGAGSPGAAPVEAEISVYPHNQHEGGAAYQWVAQAEFLSRFV